MYIRITACCLYLLLFIVQLAGTWHIEIVYYLFNKEPNKHYLYRRPSVFKAMATKTQQAQTFILDERVTFYCYCSIIIFNSKQFYSSFYFMRSFARFFV